MNKIGVVLAALGLFATLAHAEDYLSPTEDRVRLTRSSEKIHSEVRNKPRGEGLSRRE